MLKLIHKKKGDRLDLFLEGQLDSLTSLELQECLKKNNYERAEEIFNELAKEFNVDSRVEYYSKDGGFRHYHEYKLNDDGEIVLHGLTRNFHPNGMISNECFYRNGKPEGKLREYSELGEPLAGE